jgi:hypothetical protein
MTKEVDLAYLKPGCAIGGATRADVELLKLAKEVGASIGVHTGFIQPAVQSEYELEGWPVSINQQFDREFPQEFTSENVSQLEVALSTLTSNTKCLMISQSFLGDSPIFNTALSNLLSKNDHQVRWLRHHDHIRDVGLLSACSGDNLLGLPTTLSLEKRIKDINPQIQTKVLPCFVDSEKFIRQSEHLSPQTMREHLGISVKDTVIFQPTRVDSRKRIGKALYLAVRLQHYLKDRKVILLVAGGNEPIPKCQEEKRRLVQMADDHRYQHLVFLNGLDNMSDYRRISDYLRPGVTNISTFMSSIDAFGLPPLESAIAGVPCLTSTYNDDQNYPAFRNTYEGFSFLIDDHPDDNKVSDATVMDVLHKVTNPEENGDSNQLNQQLAEKKYGKASVKDTLKKLLLDHNIV